MSLADKILEMSRLNPIEKIAEQPFWQKILQKSTSMQAPFTPPAFGTQPPPAPTPASLVPLWSKIIGLNKQQNQTYAQAYGQGLKENIHIQASAFDPNASPEVRKQGQEALTNIAGTFVGGMQKIVKPAVQKAFQGAKGLIQEARKYYHVTSAENAQSIQQSGFKPQIGERSLGVANAKGTWLYEDISPTNEFGKNFTRVGKKPAIVETKVNGKIFDATNDERSIRGVVEDKKLIAKLKSEGYVGVKGDELGTSATFIFEPKAIEVVKPVNPLILEARKYKSAEEFVKSKTKSNYAMSHRPSETGATANDISKNGMIPKDFYTHPEYYANMKDVTYQQSFKVLKVIKGDPEAGITIYRASPKGELNRGDWVTLSREYANQSAAKGEAVHSYRVQAKDIQFAGDDMNEFGYYPKKATGKESQLTDIWNKANKK